MSSIPLYLKIKGGPPSEETPHFNQTSPTTIEFQNDQFDFTHIYNEQDTDYHQLLNNDRSSCIILIGPTGSGKTTMLKHLVGGKVKSFVSGNVPVGSLVPPSAFVTAFEITSNKYILDLLGDNLHKRIPLFNYESQLKREKVNEDTLKHIFKKRSTQATEVNPNSSRSCLVVTFYYMNHRTTLIDLMGNERNNVFANTNISSITQLLATKQNVGRSNNLVTNMIFKNNEIQMVMTLDPRGDVGLIKSTLNNVGNLITKFKLSSPVKSSTTSRIPSYARPTLSSKTLSAVPRKIVIAPKKVVATRVIPKRVIKRPVTSYASNSPIKPVVEKISKLELTIENLQQLNSQLQQQLSNKETSNSNEIDSLNSRIQTQRESFIKSVSEIKTDFNSIKCESSTLVNSFKLIGENLESISKKLSDAECTIDEKDKLIEQLESDLTERLQELEKVKFEIVQLEQDLQENKQQTEQTISELSNSKSHLTERITDLQAELDGKEDSIIKLNESLDVKNKLVDELQEDKLKNTEKLEGLQQELGSLKGRLDLKVQELEKFNELEETTQSKQSDIDELKELNEKYTSEISQLKDRLTQHEENQSKIETLNQEAKTEHQQQIDKLTEEIKSKTNELATVSQQLDKIKIDHEIELAQEQKLHCEAKSKWKHSVEELQLKINKKKQEIEQLKQEVQNKDETITTISTQLDLKTEEISKLTSQVNELTHKQIYLNEVVESNNQTVQDWVNKYNEMINLKDGEIKKLQDQLDYSTGDQLIHDINLGYSGFNPEEIYQDKEFTDDMTMTIKPASDITTILKPLNTTTNFKLPSPDKILKPSSKLNSSPMRQNSKVGSSPLKKHLSCSPKKKRKSSNLETIKAKYQKLSSPSI